MPDEKMRVTWDEINSPETDAKVKQQEAIARAGQHYQQQTPVSPPQSSMPTIPAPTGQSAIWRNNAFVLGAFGIMGGVITWFAWELELRTMASVGHSSSDVFLLFATPGAIIALFLSVAEPLVGGNRGQAIRSGSLGAFIGFLGGALALLLLVLVAVAFGGTDDGMVFFRTVGWTVLGSCLALAPGIIMRSWRRFWIGVAGGAAGGFLGGIIFTPMGHLEESFALSRAIALCAVGGMTGVATGLIEAAVKTGWLKVVAGLITGKQFVIYRNPTTIGSSPQCEIYLFKDIRVTPRHAAIHTVPGGFEIEDLSNGATFVNGQNVQRKRLAAGDQIQIGGTVLAFQEKVKTTSST